MMFQQAPQQSLKIVPKPATTSTAQPATASAESQDDNRFRQPITFDGKRMRKAVMRKTVDYNSSVVKLIENRKWFKDLSKRSGMQPDDSFSSDVFPPACLMENPINAVTTKFVRTSTNKLRCPIFCVAWTPEGRRLVTGASSGEFTLWNGLTFNFETILQAHDSPVRSMVWSHADNWLLSSDHGGFIKYWQSNMNNVKMYEAHKEPIRGLSFSPTDQKFASCSDDGLVKIWDFYRCSEERVLRGHGADVKCVDWHPTKSLVVSGSKDSQQPIKLWDPRTGYALTTLHAHKSTVMQIRWNQNGNCWHPVHESLFVSGGSDGSMMFWVVGAEKDVGNMEMAHEGMVWSLAWHPLGHILCSGSNDHSSKFWTRNRLGDKMRDKYNLNIVDAEDDVDGDHPGITTTAIPGMDTALNPTEDVPDIDRYNLGEKGPSFGPGNSLTNRATPTRPRQVESQNPGFTLPNFKNSPGIPGLGEITPAVENGNSSLRPDAPAFKPARPGERNHMGPFEPPAPQRHLQLNNFQPEKDPRLIDGPQGNHSQFPPGRPRGDFDVGKPGRESWEEPRGAPDWREQGPNDFGHHGRDFRPDEGGPNFRGPPGDRFHSPMSDRQGLLGSPPKNLEMDSRPGLLGAPPPQQPKPLLQGPNGPPAGTAGPTGNDFPRLGPGPNKDPRQDQGSWRPHPNEREGDRNELSPRFDMSDPRRPHPHDISSRGFRRGAQRGRGHDSPPRHGSDMEGPNQKSFPHPQSHPFLSKLSSRGFKSGVQGMHENRDPRWAAPSDEPPQGRGPDEPPGLFSRRDSWGSPHDPRVQQRDEPRDPRMMRGPGGPPSRPDQNPSNANENKPAIRPLMSLSPPPLPLGQQGFDFDLGLGEDSWKGPPDRRGRKRSLDQEGFRDDRDRGPPKALRPEDEWRRGPDQGPPDGWRGPDERMDDGPWGDFGSEADGSMRGRGKPRGGRRGRGGRR
ncbi:hypothetical protein pdam_00004175 [Pocillopora damicornis]|uniref:Uncharacterized protein n=1 Tax=Pocillopora damicornis TaxID=46731 RepID=A0A3M6TWM6_POCDA|nr:hypothetical protein pdam_00004175 [Pocillopora damicornis]